MMTSHAQHYTVTGYMPGYMPNDDDPRAMDFSTALDALADDLDRQGDSLLDQSSILEDWERPDCAAQLEAEADRVWQMASQIRDTVRELTSDRQDPSQLHLEGENYPLDYIRTHGLSVHVEDTPDSEHSLGWVISLEPVPEGIAVCEDCGSMWEDRMDHVRADCPECSRL